jgi:hypothetical protein
VTSTALDPIRSAFMLFVWAQFELQVGIMCASAPALRVFFRRYLGGTTQNSTNQNSTHPSSHGTMPSKSITVVRDTNVDFERNGAAARPTEKLETHELRDLRTPISEDGEDGLSDTSRAQEERDLTRYSHEESQVGNSRSSWLDTASAKRQSYAPRI